MAAFQENMPSFGDILIEAFERKNFLQRPLITKNGKEFEIPCLSN